MKREEKEIMQVSRVNIRNDATNTLLNTNSKLIQLLTITYTSIMLHKLDYMLYGGYKITNSLKVTDYDE